MILVIPYQEIGMKLSLTASTTDAIQNSQKAINYHRKMGPEARETDLGQVSEQLTKTIVNR